MLPALAHPLPELVPNYGLLPFPGLVDGEAFLIAPTPNLGFGGRRATREFAEREEFGF